MIALQIRLLRMRVGMRDRHDLVGGERLRAFTGFLQNRDQLVLRRIVERILQRLLNFTTALRRMFDIPMRGFPDRLNRRNQIAVAELRLDLKEIHDAPHRGCGSARHGAGTKALTRIFTVLEPRPNSRLPQRRRPYAKSSKVAVAITFPSLATISNSLPATASQRNSTVEPSAPPNSI